MNGTVTDTMSVTCAGATNELTRSMLRLAESALPTGNSWPCRRAVPGMSVPFQLSAIGTVVPGWHGSNAEQITLGSRPLMIDPSNLKPWLPRSDTGPGTRDWKASVPWLILMVSAAAAAETAIGGAASLAEGALGAVGGEPQAATYTLAIASATLTLA